MSQQGRRPNDTQSRSIALDLLTPEYKPERHKLYLDLLESGLAEAEVRNVALTGAYGTGKSSVLVQLAKTDKHKALNISLSSMGLDEDPTGTEGRNLTNRIQKEIVKQILYTVEPVRASRSRFDRISRGRRRDGLFLAVLMGVTAATAITYGRHISAFVVDGFPRPLIAFALVFLAISGATYLIAQMVRGRVSVNEVSAGPAKVSLSRATTSYFDEYLDEIVYFFEVTQYNLVIFEDIDRFDDTGIFETLRSLNTLLNSAPQLKSRPVRFVYALRDSLFQKLEEDLSDASVDDEQDAALPDEEVNPRRHDIARRDVERANRTKFFDLVIPVVPFITRENARDIMTKDFRKDGYGISDRLLNIVARHIADMRLVTNIRNEYQIFHYHLIDGPHAVPELDPDRLLAIVVYKNVHLKDFEKIRLGTSNLDTLYTLGRNLVTHNVHTWTIRVQTLREALANQDAMTYRSEALGLRLARALKSLDAFITERPYNHPVAPEFLTSTDFWSSLAAGAQGNRSLQISGQAIALTPALIGGLLNEPLTQERWDNEMRPRLERELSILEGRVARVTRASWEQLFASPSTLTASKESFARATRRILGSDLAADLVQHGYLDEYFSLNIAPFYAEHISRNAMNFVQRNIDRGVSDLFYVLSGDDVDAILKDRPQALEDVGSYNVTLLDHLLKGSPELASTVIRNIPTAGSEEVQLLNAYVEHGSRLEQFVTMLAPIWTNVFSYLAEDAGVDLSRQTRMFDAALRSWSDKIPYELSPAVRTFIEDNYAHLPSISGTGAVTKSAQIAVRAGVTFTDLDPVGDKALVPIREAHAYRITATNLTRLTGIDSLSLDELGKQDAVVYAHVLANLSDYLVALDGGTTIDNPKAFLGVLKDIADHDGELVEVVVAHADPECVLTNIADAPPATWPALASQQRFTPSVMNFGTYISGRSVDSQLTQFIDRLDTITSDDVQPESMDVVVAIVNASRQIRDPARRVALVAGIRVAGHIVASDIPRESTDIVGLLLERNLVEDSGETFVPELVPDPRSFAVAVAASNQFSTFMSPALVSGDRLAAVMSSDSIGDDVKRAIIDDMPGYLVEAPPGASLAVANYCLKSGIELDESQLAILQTNLTALSMIRLLAQSNLTGEALVRLVRGMGGAYAEVSTRGNGKVRLPDDRAHTIVVDRLRSAGIVSSFHQDGHGQLEIWRRRGAS